MRAADELTGTYPEPTALGRIGYALAVVLFSAAFSLFPVVLIVAEVGNALHGNFRSFGCCSAVSLVFLAVLARALWRGEVWEPPRVIRRFRYAGGVLEYRTTRHGGQALPLAQVEGIYRRLGRREQLRGWCIRRTDGEWLILRVTTENCQELIDQLCRDGGWGEPAPSPV